MNTKTPISFLPFLGLAIIICLAAVTAVYLRFSLHPAPVASATVSMPAVPSLTREASLESATSNATAMSRFPSVANAYPAFATPTATITSTSPAMHGYPAPRTTVSAQTRIPKDVPTEGTSVASEHMIFLPMISNGKPAFGLQASGVITTQGFSGCNWTGVAGVVFDLSGNPISNLIVHLQGTWSGSTISQDAITGSATEYADAGGYLFVLGTQPIASSNMLSVQLLDANRKILSLPIPFSTFSDCAHNLVLVNFTQNY
jgi:hypothetical protein